MTQLTLFTDLTPRAVSGAISGAVSVPTPVVESVPVVVSKAERAGQAAARPNVSKDSGNLMQLAELIRQGREQMQAQARRRSRPVQSIGDLAQAVLLRHDLVARRRARTNSGRTGTGSLAGTGVAARQADLADTPSEVHVAS